MRKASVFRVFFYIACFFLASLFVNAIEVNAVTYDYKSGNVIVKSKDVVVNSFSYDYLTVLGTTINDGDVDLTNHSFYSSKNMSISIDHYDHWWPTTDDDDTTYIYKYNVENNSFDILIKSFSNCSGTMNLGDNSNPEGLYKIKYVFGSDVRVNYVLISKTINEFEISVSDKYNNVSVFNKFNFNLKMKDAYSLGGYKYYYSFGDSEEGITFSEISQNLLFNEQGVKEIDKNIGLSFDSVFISSNDNDKKYFYFKVVDSQGEIAYYYRSSERYVLSNEVKGVINLLDSEGNVVDISKDKAYYNKGDTIYFSIILNASIKYENLEYSIGNSKVFKLDNCMEEATDSITFSYLVEDSAGFIGDFKINTKNNLDAIVNVDGENIVLNVDEKNANFIVDFKKPIISIVTEGIAEGYSYYDVEINIDEANLDSIYYYVATCVIPQGNKCTDKYNEENKNVMKADFLIEENGNNALITIDESVGRYDKESLVLFIKAVDKSGNFATTSKSGYVLDNVIIPEEANKREIFLNKDILDTNENVIVKFLSVKLIDDYGTYMVKYKLGEEKSGECVVSEHTGEGYTTYDCFSVNYDFRYNVEIEISDIFGNIEIHDAEFRYSTIVNGVTVPVEFDNGTFDVNLYNQGLYEIEYVENNLMRIDLDVAVLNDATFNKFKEILNLYNIPNVTNLKINLIYFNGEKEVVLVENVDSSYNLPKLEELKEMLQEYIDFNVCATTKCNIDLYFKYEYNTDGVLQERFIRIKYEDNSNKFVINDFEKKRTLEYGEIYNEFTYKYVNNLNSLIDSSLITKNVHIVHVGKEGISTVVDKVNSSVLGIYLVKETFIYNCVESFPLEYTVTVVDAVAPTIKLNGNSKITIRVGDKFDDPLVTVNDNYEKELVVLTKSDPQFDVDKVGTYTISYWVVDSSGNVSEIVTRTIVVEEKVDSMTYLIIGGIIIGVLLTIVITLRIEFGKRKKKAR